MNISTYPPIDDTQPLLDDALYTIRNAANEAIAVRCRNKFLLRVIKQALLTNGGEIKVDPALSEAAEKDPREVQFVGSCICLYQP